MIDQFSYFLSCVFPREGMLPMPAWLTPTNAIGKIHASLLLSFEKKVTFACCFKVIVSCGPVSQFQVVGLTFLTPNHLMPWLCMYLHASQI